MLIQQTTIHDRPAARGDDDQLWLDDALDGEQDDLEELDQDLTEAALKASSA